MSRARGAIAFVAAVLLAPSAGADPVRVESVREARPVIRIYHAGLQGERPLKTCLRGCSVDLPPGRYHVAVDATPGTYAYDDEVTVAGPTRVAVDVGDKTARRTAVAAGWTLIGLSVPLFMFGMIYEWKDNPENGEKGRFGVFSIAGSVVGGLGLIALVSAVTNKPSIDAHRVDVAAAPTTGGAVLGGSIVF